LGSYDDNPFPSGNRGSNPFSPHNHPDDIARLELEFEVIRRKLEIAKNPHSKTLNALEQQENDLKARLQDLT